MGCGTIFKTTLSDKKSVFKMDKVEMNCDKFMDIVDKLYEKYVKFGAIYEINISYPQRLALAILIDPKYKDKAEFYHQFLDGEFETIPKSLPRNNLAAMITIVIPIFEQCVSSLLRLLESSFDRFKRTQEWMSIHKKLGITSPTSALSTSERTETEATIENTNIN